MTGDTSGDIFLVEVVGRHVEWVPVCPEVEMGLGVPRDTLRLEQQGGRPPAGDDQEWS